MESSNLDYHRVQGNDIALFQSLDVRLKPILFCRQGVDIFDKDAFKKLQVLEQTLRIERELKQRMTDRSAKAFFKEFNKMVDAADVVIQVSP